MSKTVLKILMLVCAITGAAIVFLAAYLDSKKHISTKTFNILCVIAGILLIISASLMNPSMTPSERKAAQNFYVEPIGGWDVKEAK